MISKSSTHRLLSGEIMDKSLIDVTVRAISVGQPHRAVPVTVAMAIAAAANLKGSVVQRNLSSDSGRVDEAGITIGHSSGRILVGARFGGEGRVESVNVFRTARRLMSGLVYWR